MDAMRSAQVAIESAVCTWELSTGGDWSINCVIESWFLPASIASDVDPSTMRDSSGPRPGDGLVRFVDDGAQVVLRDRLQRSVGGVEQASDVGRNLRPADRDDIAVAQRLRASSSPALGVSSTNCSPTAERLCTAAETSDGTLVDESSFRTARTPSGVTSMDVTLPISEPR